MANMKAMYRIWGQRGHRFKGSWQASTKIELDNGMTVETWCFDRTGSHEYVDMEVTGDYVSPADLYDELQTQLDDGVFECCSYGKIEKLKYSYYWTNGCPTNKDFNEAVVSYEHILNCYAIDGGLIPYVNDNMHFYVPEFHGNRFTVRREVLK